MHSQFLTGLYRELSCAGLKGAIAKELWRGTTALHLQSAAAPTALVGLCRGPLQLAILTVVEGITSKGLLEALRSGRIPRGQVEDGGRMSRQGNCKVDEGVAQTALTHLSRICMDNYVSCAAFSTKQG